MKLTTNVRITLYICNQFYRSPQTEVQYQPQNQEVVKYRGGPVYFTDIISSH
jgi:hypothetical protein